ncbi:MULTISPECIES: ABC transporter permease [Kitasatospora]|uniref:ABC-2 type transport system permease protein n=1 Tax=Kitasatospora cineracea TaxID=88074 RepID=A0A3N4RW33_9ACTN|nr:MULTISPECIES: ABC transporter permease subunit [Kitasatospora]ROR44896.1 ABC-2 type transport system permease protein [Kitasatospora cineracea]RPE35261.1 ABC-2 type transport system permease protein [Kitasatospora cineracea]WAL71367.1 ABC transporter permease subunit [Kitasatospora sp. YST-16]WNW37403.1 ABC transporter permease subunit [Streptomyces sp. Li-HN-5-13]
MSDATVLGAGRDTAAPGYRPGRTLPLRVEAMRQLRRRRTLVVGGVLAVLPFVVLAAFQIGGTPGRENRTTFIELATASGANFAATLLFMGTGFLLVIPVALFAGDTVASEASWSSLRYLLAAPVPRARLLVRKFAVAMAFSAAAVVLLPAVGLVVGTAAYGWGDLKLPTGATLSAAEALPRLAIAVLYVFLAEIVVGALAFWLSTATDAPLGAVGGAVFASIITGVLDAVTALGSLREWLPAHWQYAWADALQPQLEWGGMVQGVVLSLSYAVVLLALAFRGFAAKDVVS